MTLTTTGIVVYFVVVYFTVAYRRREMRLLVEIVGVASRSSASGDPSDADERCRDDERQGDERDERVTSRAASFRSRSRSRSKRRV